MSALLMWTLGDQVGVETSEPIAQATTGPVRDDGPAEMPNAPEFNEIETDQSGELTGLAQRNLAGDTTVIEKYSPWWLAKASSLFNAPIDEQVSSSGTAAAREAEGQSGHGTMQFTQSIDPVLHDGMVMGNDYFQSNPMDVQEGAGSYMTPTDVDNFANALNQARGTDNSRLAAQSSLYSAFLGA